MAVTPEIDRSFISNYGTSRSYHAFIIKVYTDLCGPEAAAKYQEYPILNTGVLAIPAASPIWERWSCARIAESLSHGRNFHVEQASLNHGSSSKTSKSMWRTDCSSSPSRCNWVCHQALPKLDTATGLLVEPFPNAPLGILHRASDDFKQKKTASVATLDGQIVEMNLKYREGNYETDLETTEPEKLKRRQDAGFRVDREATLIRPGMDVATSPVSNRVAAGWLVLCPLALFIFIDAMGFAMAAPILASHPVSSSPTHQAIIYGVGNGNISPGHLLRGACIGRHVRSDRAAAHDAFLRLWPFLDVHHHRVRIVRNDSATLVILGRLIGGFMGATQAIALAAMADVGEPSGKDSRINIGLPSSSLGFVLGPVLAGALAGGKVLPQLAEAEPLLAVVILTWVTLLWIRFTVPAGKHTEAPAAALDFSSSLRDLAKTFRSPVLKRLAWIFLFQQIAWGAFFFFIAPFLIHRLGFDSARASYYVAMLGIGFCLSFAFVMPLLRKCLSARAIGVGGMALTAICIGISALVPLALVQWAVAIPAAIATAAGYGAIIMLFTDEARGNEGEILGVTASINALAFGITSLTGGVIASVSPAAPLALAAGAHGRRHDHAFQQSQTKTNHMKTVLLAGGFGTRLSEYTDDIPKPMVPVGGLPMLWHIMSIYSHFGHNEFLLALGYKAEYVKSFFLNYETLHSDFIIDMGTGKTRPRRTSGRELETGPHRHRAADHDRRPHPPHGAPFLGDETFMATYGDGVSDIDIDELLKFHKSHGKLVTMTLARPAARFGTVDFDSTGRVFFKEKPIESAGYVNAGFFVMEPQFIEYIDDDHTILERDPLGARRREGS